MHFLFNLSLLIILFFLCFSIFRRSGSILLHKRTALLYFTVSLALCNIFTYPFGDEFVLDLRIIPFLIGGLYLRLSPALGLLVIFMRGFHGIDFGFMVACVIYTTFSFYLWVISPWFMRLTSNHRILFSMGHALFLSVGILILVLKIAPSNVIPDLFFAYLVVPPLGVVIIAYIIEMIEKNILLRHQLIIAEKLEAIEQMGAAISHEIRNPLTTALGFVELLYKDTHDMEKRTQYLAILKDELDSAERIIQDYLSYSKPILESVEPLNVQEELTHVIKLLQPLANYHSVKLSTNFSSTRLMEGDRSKFQQCFINIIKNSIESRPNGGTLLIEAVETTTHIVITIQDNETSICSEQLKQKDFSMTLSFSIVRAMKGTIDEVKKENGKGKFLKFSFKPIKPHLKR